ncbi:hypothetical protein KC338_g7936 [Hortaea werneckii]|nr:hypothetical protein KC338_g7936 [Hortaea werneckii]
MGIGPIDRIDIQRIGENTGHTDEVYRIQLVFPDESPESNRNKPSSVILKILDASQAHRAPLAALNAREVRFYRTIAPALDLDSIPECYFADFDETLKVGNIVLEDAGKVAHNSELATATAAQAAKTMQELGRFHGTTLSRSSLLPTDLARPLEPSSDELVSALPAFVETWQDHIGHAGIARYERAVEAYSLIWLKQRDCFLQGLVHGDYRIGNVLFGVDDFSDQANPKERPEAFASGIKDSIAQRHTATLSTTFDPPEALPSVAELSPPVAPPRALASHKPNLTDVDAFAGTDSATIIDKCRTYPGSVADDRSGLLALDHAKSWPHFKHVDWQTVFNGPVALDVAYFLSISLDLTTRRQCETELIDLWYGACRNAAGAAFPSDLTLAECKRQVSIACIKAVVVSVTTLNHVQMPELAMRTLGQKLNMVSLVLDDWNSFG